MQHPICKQIKRGHAMQVSTQGDDDQTKDSTTRFFLAPVNYYIDLRYRLITSATNYCRCYRMCRPPTAGSPLRASFARKSLPV